MTASDFPVSLKLVLKSEGGNDDLKAKIRMLSEFIKQAIDDRRELVEKAQKLGIDCSND